MKKLLIMFAAAIMLLGVQNANAIVYTALSGSNWNEGEGPAKLFDGTTNTKWGTHDDNPYVVFKTSSPIKPSQYKLVIANDTYKNTGRNWKNWKIYAGNFASEADAVRNASGWVMIDSKENQTLPTGTEQNPFEEQTLSISESVSTEYSYFKIEIEALAGSWNDYCQMDGFTFTAYTLPFGTVEFTCTAKQGNNSNASEGMEKLFDGVYTTKYCGDVTYTDNEDVVHPAYAIVEASSAVYCWGYDMTTANDNEQYGRCVKKWTLYGSNDASAKTDANHSSWVALSALAKNDLVQQKNNYTQRFFCDLDKVGTAYKYFKVTLDDGGSVQLTQFKLCYETCPVVSYNWESGQYDSTTDRNGDTETKKAVDGLLNQKMEGNDLSGSWVIIKTANDNAYTVKSYSFSTHDDGNGGCNNRAPKTWIIEGSNDKSSWTTIDEVTSGDPIDNLNYKTFEFKPSNVDGAFKYIKLTLNSMKGTGWTQVGEFHVTNGCASHTWVDLDYVAPTCVSDGGGEKQCSVCGVTKLTGVEPATGNHTYDANGFCIVCNQPNPNFMTKNGDFYEPTTVVQFNWLKAMIQSGATVNIRLTQDVDLSGFAGFGNGEEVNDHLVPFSGEFDGGGHWIKNLHIDVVKKNTGLFGLTNGANFHDLGFFNAYVKVNGTQNVGIIVGNAKNTTFNRVAVMNGSKVEGFDHVGAFVGNTEGTCVISNCITDAEVYSTTYQAGGFVGTSSGLTLEKSLFLGSVGCGNGAGDVGGFISRIEKDNATTIQNNVMAATMLTTAKTTVTPLVAQHTNSTYANNRVAASTIFKSTDSNAADDLKAGKTMVFNDIDGYQGKTTADADMQTASFYSSTMAWDMENDWYFFAEGHYPVLKWMVANISNANELMAFASKVNSGMTDLVGKLTADINLSGKTWEPIGNGTNKYTGTFDGQDHAITNFSYTSTGDYNGLFGFINNATVKNFSISGSLTSTHKENGAIGYADGASVVSGVHSSLDITVNCRTHSGGVVGASASDTSTLRVDGCSYSGTLTIEGTDADVTGGIIGYTYYGTIQNCIFSGTINGNADDKPYGGILGYAKIETFGGIHNCLVLGKIVTNASNTTASILIGKWNGPATSNVGNNYYLPNAGSSSNVVLVGGNTDNVTAPILVTTEQLASGEITAKLGYAFHQNLGIDATPTLDKTKGYVTQIGTAGYSTQYITDSDVTIPSNIEAFAGVINGSNITLESITDKIAAGEPVVLRGTEGIYNFMPTTGATEATENNLKGSDGTVTGGDNIYALAKKGNPAEVGFYPVSSSVKIPAGRVYLEYTAPTPVKGFYGFEEDDATGISLMEDGRSKMEDGAIYNVAGQRINKMQKGINIVNGKKVLK